MQNASMLFDPIRFLLFLRTLLNARLALTLLCSDLNPLSLRQRTLTAIQAGVKKFVGEFRPRRLHLIARTVRSCESGQAQGQGEAAQSRARRRVGQNPRLVVLVSVRSFTLIAETVTKELAELNVLFEHLP